MDRRAVAAACLATVVGVAVSVQAGAAAASAPSVVVAVVGEPGGINVLHQDFRTADGRTPAYPAGMPRPVVIQLPVSGTFASQRAAVESGVLGHLRPGILYGIAGTRLLLINTGANAYDAVQADAVHATGVADAVTGTRYGTDPKALVVVAFSNRSQTDSYRWLTHAPWVDIASTSDYQIATSDSPTQCAGAPEVRTFTSAGHQLFSSAGNTTDQPEPLVAPNGLPQTYLVGGVTADGDTWLPGHPAETNPFYEFGNVVRPYETGELYSFRVAAPDSFAGTQHFGGTSGATPRTAGEAAVLIQQARQDVGQVAPVTGVLAAGPRHLRRGPLDDGRFTAVELTRLLHHVAVPHSGLPDGPQYAVEGYGALNASAVQTAAHVLNASQVEPSRPGDDQADTAARQVRQMVFTRC
ncbi:MAG: hypothetical protein JWL79_2258 [Frankiales bacterium]|nr:hypothetical protein [Frankiales bacterium]